VQPVLAEDAAAQGGAHQVTRRVMPEAVQIAPPGLDKADREQWLALRREGIGGSDIAAILGMNKYHTALDVYVDKMGLGEAPQSERLMEAARMGHLMESVIAREFATRTGLRLLRPPGLMSNADRPWMLATVDWLCTDLPAGRVPLDQRIILELKTRSAYQAAEWRGRTADAPAIQCAWYLAVTGARYGYVAALIGGNYLTWERLDRDEELITMLIEAAEDFRRDHLEPGIPPEPDGSPRTSDLLGSIWAGDPDTFAYLDADVVGYREMARQAAADRAAAEEQQTWAENQVKLAMGDAEVAFAAGTMVATWVRNGTFAPKRFTADHPEVAEKYRTMRPGIDVKRLEREEPALYREYCARVLRFVNEERNTE
jgi:putative phage-type endonuclease